MPRLSALAIAVIALLPSACAHAPASNATTGNAIEGRVTAIDTAPWAYDGSGVLTVDTANGSIRVALPARWNLCKGRGLDTAGNLKVGDRVRVTGTAGGDGTVDACTAPTGSIERL
ncbi:hypothetical protein [Lysobacter claricitrinus]|uniref:hypothetical protein n=1 Tax=Lysobacter claricitrinus TaxID=3367728 RepID=UPI0038B255AB